MNAGIRGRWLLRRLAVLSLCVLPLPSCSSCSKGVPKVENNAPPTVPRVRVLLADGVESVNVGVSGAYDILTRRGRAAATVARTGSGLSSAVQCDGGSISCEGVSTSDALVIRPKQVPVEVDGKSYRGSVEILLRGGRMRVINVLDMESYVRGILSLEMQTNWPAAALEAQAVAARSYANIRLTERKNDDFDVQTSVADQRYGGIDAESSATDEAVRRTRGLILMYKGKPFVTYYHSTCGGQTADGRVVFGRPELPPPLQGAACGFCGRAPRTNWTIRMSVPDVAQKLGQPGLYGLAIDSVGGDGRVVRVTALLNGSGNVSISGTDFRQRLGLYSTRFSMSASGANFVFQGGGYGHGVGLCQWGARGMADGGYSYKEILDRYYPGSKLTKVYP